MCAQHCCGGPHHKCQTVWCMGCADAPPATTQVHTLALVICKGKHPPYQQPHWATTMVVDGSRGVSPGCCPATRVVEFYFAYYLGYYPVRVVAGQLVPHTVLRGVLLLSTCTGWAQLLLALCKCVWCGWHSCMHILARLLCYRNQCRPHVVHLDTCECSLHVLCTYSFTAVQSLQGMMPCPGWLALLLLFLLPAGSPMQPS
jgi:hypothetical protein